MNPPSAHPNDVSRPDARSIAEEVAAVLGEPWSLAQLGEASRDRGLLLAPSDVELYFRIDARHSHLVRIGGGYPPDPFYRTEVHEIRVAHTRGARVIAAQIVRRLLPDYLSELRLAQDRTREHAAAMATRAALLERLQVLLPGTTAPQGHGHSHTVVYLTCPHPVWGSARIDLSGTTATLELRSLPADLLERILTLLAVPGSD